MKKISDAMNKELTRFSTALEGTIDFSDIPETIALDWKNGIRRKFYKPVKQQLTIRLDTDVLAWLKGQGRAIKAG